MSEERGLPDSVDAERARELIGRGEVRVVDIRDEDDFASERMTNAIRSDPDGVREALGERETGREAVLVVCADGSRSADVAGELREEGVDATSIDGGFEAWTSKEYPTAPGRDEEYEGPEVKLPGAVASEGGPADEDDEDEGGDEPAERAEEA